MVERGGLVDCFGCCARGAAASCGEGWVLVAEGGEGAECFLLGHALVDLDDLVGERVRREEDFLVVWDLAEVAVVLVSRMASGDFVLG